jgi:hypothetical protein
MAIPKIIFDTAANFTSRNWTLQQGTIGFETDTNKFKIGTGSTAWTSLGYNGGGQSGSNLMTTPVPLTVAIREYGDGRDVVSVCTLTDFVVGAIPGAGALAIGNIVAAYPAGNHIELAYYYSLSLKIPGTAVAAPVGVGSVIGAGAVAVLSGTATFMDRITSSAITTAAGGGTVVESLKTPTAGVLTGIAMNVTASIKNAFLNAAGTWNANNAGNLTATGTVVFSWTKMGA